MDYHPNTATDDEDHYANLQAQLRLAIRHGDSDRAARIRSQMSVMREDMQREFEARFDGARFVTRDDQVAPNVTYTTPRQV